MNSIFIFEKILETSDSVRLKLLFSSQQTMKEMLFNLLKQKISDESMDKTTEIFFELPINNSSSDKYRREVERKVGM